MLTLSVMGVRVDEPTGAPVLLLKDEESSRYLPIWIGPTEAAAIVSALEGMQPPRPLTHDLFAEALRLSHTDKLAVRIVAIEDHTFMAELAFGEHVLSARPSDAVALAVRLGLPVKCAEEVLAQAGVELTEPEQTEVEAFMEFLDSVNPDDFKD